MGTRGAFGVIVGEKEKISYNHFDSYPDGKGIEVLRWLRESIAEGELENLRVLAEAARVVGAVGEGDGAKPTAADKRKLKQYTDANVNEQSLDDWYCLTRGLHGDIGEMLKVGYIPDAGDFPLDSLFCEWAYIVDFDKRIFEVYVGFQRTPPKAGRWAGRPTPEEWAITYAEHLKWCAETDREPWYSPDGPEHYAVDRIASYAFEALPTDQEFLGYFRLVRARDALADADKYPADLAQIVVEIEDEHLNTTGPLAENWQAIYDSALEKLSPSDTLKVRMGT